jgi:hypothetical protein
VTRYSPRTGLPTTYQVGPFDGGHLYLQWGGKLPGNEQWSNGLRLAPVAAANSGDPAGLIAGCVAAIQAWHVHVDSAIHPFAKLSFVKLNMINTAGHYATDETFETILADVAGGGSSTVYTANQLALAISLKTAVSRGAAHRGRFYAPLPTPYVTTDGTIAAADRDKIKARATALLAALNAVSANYDVAIYSRKAGNPGHRLVTGIEVGRVLDTQRRRRRSVAELY